MTSTDGDTELTICKSNLNQIEAALWLTRGYTSEFAAESVEKAIRIIGDVRAANASHSSTLDAEVQERYALKGNPYPPEMLLCPDCKTPIAFPEGEIEVRCEECREFFFRPYYGRQRISATPDADARQMIEDVVKELEEKKAKYDKRANSTTDFSQHTRLSDISFGIGRAITLLKGGVERK